MFIIYLLLGLIIFSTHFLEGITGFGCTIIAMPFAIMLVGISTAKPLLTIAAFILCFYITIRNYTKVNVRVLAHILVIMLIGLPIGILSYSYLPEAVLKKSLAVFMVLVSVRGLLISYNKSLVNFKLSKPFLNFALFLSGIIHGAFTSGGPLAILYATENLHNKDEFRATLCALWSVLNSILIVQQLFSNRLTSEVWNCLFVTLPFLMLGIFFGNIAHRKIRDKYFTPLSYLILLISSSFMSL